MSNASTISVSVQMQPASPTPCSPPPPPPAAVDQDLKPKLKLNIPVSNDPNACYHHRLNTYSNTKFRSYYKAGPLEGKSRLLDSNRPTTI